MMVGFKSKNHPEQMARRGADDTVDDRRTDRRLFRFFAEQYGPFTLDAAASTDNALCERFFTREDNGLAHAWSGTVWCNPPYSDLARWILKAWREAPACDRIVMLLPANRTEQQWWQLLVEPHRDREPRDGIMLRSRFLAGRPRFGGYGEREKGQRPPFGCVLLIWEKP